MNRRAKRLITSVRPALSRVLPSFHPRARSRGACALVDCPECGEERVDPFDVTVRARIENDEWSYRFTCPSCDRRTVASTSREAAASGGSGRVVGDLALDERGRRAGSRRTAAEPRRPSRPARRAVGTRAGSRRSRPVRQRIGTGNGTPKNDSGSLARARAPTCATRRGSRRRARRSRDARLTATP